MLAQELALINDHEGFKIGAVFPYTIDYSQFVPRGHYTRSEVLQKYFRTMMWYGLVPFAVTMFLVLLLIILVPKIATVLL